MPDVITILQNNVVTTQVGGADVLLPMAVAASAANAAAALAQYNAMLAVQALGNDAAAIAARVSTAALAASTGAALVGSIRPETGAATSTVSAYITSMSATPYQFGIALGSENVNNTVKLQAWLDSGAPLLLPPGRWRNSGLVINDGDSREIIGAGSRTSVLYCESTTNNALSLAAAQRFQYCTLRGFGVEGPGLDSGTTNGIDFPASMTFGFGNAFKDLDITEFGGHMIKDRVNANGEALFSTLFENVNGYSKNHGIDILGGPGIVFVNVYPKLGTAGNRTAGIRVLKGHPLFLACNAGDKDWAIICGSETADPDGYHLCQPTVMDCNFEDTRVGGLWSKTAGPVWINSTVVSRWAGHTPIKTGAEVTTNRGSIDNIATSFSLVNRAAQPAASWANGCTVHFGGAGSFPFHTVNNVGPADFRDTSGGVTSTVLPGGGIQRLGFATFGPVVLARTFGSQLTATGTVRTDALALTAQINQVLTVAAGTGVRLPSAIVAGVGTIEIFNDSAATLKVWPDLSGDTIDATGAGLSVNLSAGARCGFRVIEGSKWRSSLLGAVSA